MSEGRRSFRRRVAGIESGAECDRLAPLLSAFVDGEATAGELALLRPHLRGCLSCRATVRDYRSTPARVAALVPPAALAGAGGESAELGARVRALEGRAPGSAFACPTTAATARARGHRTRDLLSRFENVAPLPVVRLRPPAARAGGASRFHSLLPGGQGYVIRGPWPRRWPATEFTRVRW